MDLGFEPQWVLIKPATYAADWRIYDVMRGMTTASGSSVPITSTTSNAFLEPNTSDAEATTSYGIMLTTTGFLDVNGSSGQDYIYIAIRRPMKTPEAGTDVFKPVARTGTGAEADVSAGFAADLAWSSERGTVYSGVRLFFDKLRGAKNRLDAAQAQAEVSGGTSADMLTAFTNDGVTLGSDSNWYINKSGNPYVHWLFKRATGFFDVVAYTGNGTAGTTHSHNLGVVPEFMIVKSRSLGEHWATYHVGMNGGTTPQNYYMPLSATSAEGADSDIWNNTAPTSSVFTVGGNDKVNSNTNTYIAYLFATLAGISKVGSYTGTGAVNNIDCGFSAGARFVMIKSTSAGDWQIFDTARGIVSGNDPRLLVRANQAEDTATDYLDYYASGFSLTSNTNVNNNSSNYIFLAIA